jgi:hypothetical protein
MKKRVVDGTEIEAGTGNVLAELGLRDAGRLGIKSGLTIEIAKAIRGQGLTQAEAARCMRSDAAQGLGPVARGVLELLRAQADGLPEPARVRHRDSLACGEGARWAPDAGARLSGILV